MKKNLLLILCMLCILCTQFLGGCSKEAEGVAFSPIVCEYSVTPTCWTVIDCISTNVRVNADNNVEIYCSDFYDKRAGEDGVSLDYIYGQQFEITEEEKQSIISAINKNKISRLSDCGDNNSSDGSYSYIYLYDENGEQVHSCGGLNPYGSRYENVVTAIKDILPEGAYKNVREAATKSLVEYLLENYPQDYSWLEDTYELN